MAKVLPLARSSRQLAFYDPKTKQFTLIDTCFMTHHLNFAMDANNTLWANSFPEAGPIGWLNTKLYDQTHDEQKSQGCAVDCGDRARPLHADVRRHAGDGDVTANELIVTNIAFRGVFGPRVPVQPTRAFLDMLMGNPINVVMWMAQALKKDGVTLKPGDLLDLGRYFPPATPQPGTSITVKYPGLSANPSVTVHFE